LETKPTALGFRPAGENALKPMRKEEDEKEAHYILSQKGLQILYFK